MHFQQKHTQNMGQNNNSPAENVHNTVSGILRQWIEREEIHALSTETHSKHGNRLFFIVANYFLWIPKMQLFLKHKQGKGNKLVTLTSRGNKLVTSTGQPIAIIHSNMLHFRVPGLLLVHQREN